jgi:hypothetical protein
MKLQIDPTAKQACARQSRSLPIVAKSTPRKCARRAAASRRSNEDLWRASAVKGVFLDDYARFVPRPPNFFVIAFLRTNETNEIFLTRRAARRTFATGGRLLVRQSRTMTKSRSLKAQAMIMNCAAMPAKRAVCLQSGQRPLRANVQVGLGRYRVLLEGFALRQNKSIKFPVPGVQVSGKCWALKRQRPCVSLEKMKPPAQRLGTHLHTKISLGGGKC